MSLSATARTVEIEADALAAIDACYERGWTDGLPDYLSEQRHRFLANDDLETPAGYVPEGDQ